MNRQSRFSLSLGYQLAIAFAIAVFMPIIILAVLSYSSATQVSLKNLQSFVEVSSTRRQEAIENDFRAAFNSLDDFLASASNQAQIRAVVNPITLEEIELQRQRAASFQTRLSNNLISTGFFDSVLLVDADGTALSTAIVPNLEFVSARAATMAELISIFGVNPNELPESQSPQALLFTRRGNRPNIEQINLLFDENSEGRTFIGYITASVNLERVLIENLGTPSVEANPYSFLLMPDGAFIAPGFVSDDNLIDLNSVGVQRALGVPLGEEVPAERYTVAAGDASRDVLGTFSRFQIENLTFSLITEIDTRVVQQQLGAFAGNIGFTIFTGGGALMLIVVLLLYQIIVPPLKNIREVVRAITRGNFDEPLNTVNRADEIGSLSNAIVDMRQHVQTLTEDMNRRLRERNRDLRVTQDIARTIAAERDLNILMDNVVNLIVANFPSIYHAQIFLVDNAGERAILRASTGKIGRNLLQRGHNLAVGSVSVIGQVTELGEVMIARDTSESDVHRENEFLTETLAELAIPLQSGGRIIGALDVQSKQRDSFDEDQVSALQTLADQITIAIENARLFEESARSLAQLERDRSLNTHQAWQQYIYSQRQQTMQKQAGQSTAYDFEALRQAAINSGKSVVGKSTERDTIPFAVPINLRGVTLGVVEYELRESEFNYNKVLLAEELVNRLAVSLDNARLFQDTQQTTQRERLVNDISTKLTGHNDIQAIIQTAIREVGQALGTPQVAVRLQIADQDNGNHPQNGHQDNAQDTLHPGNQA